MSWDIAEKIGNWIVQIIVAIIGEIGAIFAARKANSRRKKRKVNEGESIGSQIAGSAITKSSISDDALINQLNDKFSDKVKIFRFINAPPVLVDDGQFLKCLASRIQPPAKLKKRV